MVNRFWLVPHEKGRTVGQGRSVGAPYGLEIIESCLACPHRENWFFCDLPAAAGRRLAEISSVAAYPKGATLFVEGQAPRGVFVVCSGRVKLSSSSVDGRTRIVKIADPGELLGLAATVCDKPYQATADVLESAQVNFIRRQEFLNFLAEHGEAALRAAQQLSENYHSALLEMRTAGVSHSASAKLAHFLLNWSPRQREAKGEIRLKLTLTHAEIAEMIGASRETVTRLFAEFKRKQLLQVKGSTLVIPDRAALERLAGGQASSGYGGGPQERIARCEGL